MLPNIQYVKTHMFTVMLLLQGPIVMAGNGSLEEILASCLSPENLRRTQAEAALKVIRSYLANDVALASHLTYPSEYHTIAQMLNMSDVILHSAGLLQSLGPVFDCIFLMYLSFKAV